MVAYYNENDPVKAAWLRELILAGHVADVHTGYDAPKEKAVGHFIHGCVPPW